MEVKAIDSAHFSGNIFYINKNNEKIGSYFLQKIGQRNQTKLTETIQYKPYNLYIAKNNDLYEISFANSLTEYFKLKKEPMKVEPNKLQEIMYYINKAIKNYGTRLNF